MVSLEEQLNSNKEHRLDDVVLAPDALVDLEEPEEAVEGEDEEGLEEEVVMEDEAAAADEEIATEASEPNVEGSAPAKDKEGVGTDLISRTMSYGLFMFYALYAQIINMY